MKKVFKVLAGFSAGMLICACATTEPEVKTEESKMEEKVEVVEKESTFTYFNKIFKDFEVSSKFKFFFYYFWFLIKSTPDADIMLLTLICNLIFVITEYHISLAIPIICVIFFLRPVIDVFLGLKENAPQILLTLVFNLVLLYIFMWIGFVGFNQLFTYGVIDSNNEEMEVEPFCTSSVQCLLLFWSTGFFEAGTNEMIELLSYKDNPGLFIGILVFFVWYLLISRFNLEVEHARGYILALMVFIQNIHVLIVFFHHI